MKLPRPIPQAFASLLALFAAILIAAPAAYADGHAGLVIENGDGSIDTYCVAFQGDSITGADMLAKAGVSVVQWNDAVCAVGNQEGCFQPHDYASCYCQSFPPTNTYWSFFTQNNDQGWVYSPLGFQTARASDGDMQAWHWGVGSPGNAPLPPAISFAQVCGAVLAPTATPVTIPPTATPTLPAPATSTPLSTATPLPTVVPMTAGASTPTAQATAAASASPSGIATLSATAAITATSTAPVITNHGAATATPAPAPTPSSTGGGSGSSSLLAFGGVAILLLAAIGAALVYRRRHGQ